jgi:hypothetical protein
VAAPAPRLVEVRMSLSAGAADRLAEPRLRRLLEIELEDDALLAPGTAGPLGDHVAYVWIDLPSPSTALIEVRIGERAVARRELAVGGLAWDVVARFAAIATAEMVRAQMRPVRPRRTTVPQKRKTAAELEVAARDAPAAMFSGSWMVAGLPSAGVFLAGPSLVLGLRSRRASLGVGGALLGGGVDGGPVRWMEAGLSGDYRFWLTPGWRLVAGAGASLAALRMTEASAVDGVAGERDTWSARAAALLGSEWRLAPAAWLGVALEPGAVLRPAPFTDAAGEAQRIEGAWLGGRLSLVVER